LHLAASGSNIRDWFGDGAWPTCWGGLRGVAQALRVDDADVMHLLKVMLKASGKMGVPQGGVISPLLSNLYLNEVLS
jgi:hypothetical protein